MKWILFGLAGLVAVAMIGFVLIAWRTEIAPLSTRDSVEMMTDPARVEAGARLALLGNCAGCHTVAGGGELAGGLAMETPFGVIHSTNITPDRATGIGDWSLAAYARAMREGVDREGRHLYPAFPYEYFARISDADMADLYAWNMAQPPVSAIAPDNDLTFPANWRPLLAGWKLLYHTNESFVAMPERSDLWNHGAYLADGLGHCAACHTPRSTFGGAMPSRVDQGGEANDWWAPPLTAANPAPRVWTEDALFAYLRTGRSVLHGVAAGPMATVVHDSLARVPEEDVIALAHHFGDLMAREPTLQEDPPRQYGIPRAELATDSLSMGTDIFDDGARLFSANCTSYHHDSGPTPDAFPRLADGSALTGPDARNLVQVILWGIGPSAGSAQGYMPRFAEELTDAQIAAIAEHLRGDYVGAGLVAELREGGQVARAGAGPLSGFVSTVTGTWPADPGATR